MKKVLLPLLLGLTIVSHSFGAPGRQNNLPKPDFNNLQPARPVHPVVPHVQELFREHNAFRTTGDVDQAVLFFLMSSANLNNNVQLSDEDKLTINNVKDAVSRKYPQHNQRCGLNSLMDEE